MGTRPHSWLGSVFVSFEGKTLAPGYGGLRAVSDGVTVGGPPTTGGAPRFRPTDR